MRRRTATLTSETLAPDVDAVVAAFYAAFDNRGGRQPAEAALRATFGDGATITRVREGQVEVWTVDTFVSPRVAMLTDGTLAEFHEREVEARTTVVGDIASRWSRYEKTGMLGGADYRGGGQKFIQLHRTDGRWRIGAILWQDG